MNDLVKIINDVPVISTLDMYEDLQVEHRAIIKLIQKYHLQFKSIRHIDSHFQKTAGRSIEYYLLDEEQAGFLITLMRNSEVTVPFKLRMTREFYRMREILNSLASQSQNATWLEKRQAGKVTRKKETDVIKEFVEYATKQGSQSASKYYCNLTKMENSALFFIEQKFKNIRDALNLNQLSIIECADNIVEKALKDGMEQNLPYKEIYQLAKKRIEMFAEVHGKTIIPFKQKQIELI